MIFKFLTQLALNYIAGIFDLTTDTGVLLPCPNLRVGCPDSVGPPIASTILRFCVVVHSSES